MNSVTKCILAAGLWFGAVEGGITQHAKKSIFPTTDAARENDFMADLLLPLVEDGVVEQEATGSYACGVPAKFRFDNTGFEIHSPYAPQHESGGLEVDEVESFYKEKFENLMNKNNDGWYYDAILDNSMAFWVNDISTYVGYNEDTIDRLYFEWQSIGGNTYYSLITHNRIDRSDMNIYEFISDTFTNKDKYTLIKSEPRAFIDDDSTVTKNDNYDYKLQCKENGWEVIELGIRRAVSDVQANVDWYVEIFSGSIVNINQQIQSGEMIDANGNIVKYAHIMPQEDDSFSISFFERKGDKATYGDFTIKLFEEKLNIAHKQIMVNPFCCVDRWYDLHYALPLNDDTAAAKTLENIMHKDGQLYTVFEITKPLGSENEGTGMFWTMVEPNGQILQLQGPDSASSVVTIEFATQPSYWDGAWCPQENTDEFKQYSFGDDIATITYHNDDDDDDESGEVELNKYGIRYSGNARDRNNNVEILTILLPCLIVVMFACVYFLTSDKCIQRSKLAADNNNNNSTNNDDNVHNQISYTYKTF